MREPADAAFACARSNAFELRASRSFFAKGEVLLVIVDARLNRGAAHLRRRRNRVLQARNFQDCFRSVSSVLSVPSLSFDSLAAPSFGVLQPVRREG
jgi:hypothetical protein